MTIYLASTNHGKLREFQGAAPDFGFVVEPFPAISALPACEEDGATFQDNALKKALHYAAYSDGLVLADDSGLCVDALDGAPGVRSARFSGPDASEQASNQKLLRALRGVPPERRTAHYACVVALVRRDRVIATAEARADGLILQSPRGPGGFGYDPLFYYPSLHKTFAELTSDEKLQVSHRGRAFRSLVARVAGTY